MLVDDMYVSPTHVEKKKESLKEKELRRAHDEFNPVRSRSIQSPNVNLTTGKTSARCTSLFLEFLMFPFFAIKNIRCLLQNGSKYCFY